MKNLNYQSLLPIAISEGATSPNPGIVGVLVWSTTLTKTMRWSGVNWESLVTKSELDAKQPLLVSAENIKTINGVSILGAGDLTVAGGSGGVVISDTPPGSPTSGMEWFHTTSGIQYTRVGTAWVEPGGNKSSFGSVSPILSWMI